MRFTLKEIELIAGQSINLEIYVEQSGVFTMSVFRDEEPYDEVITKTGLYNNENSCYVVSLVATDTKNLSGKYVYEFTHYDSETDLADVGQGIFTVFPNRTTDLLED